MISFLPRPWQLNKPIFSHIPLLPSPRLLLALPLLSFPDLFASFKNRLRLFLLRYSPPPYICFYCCFFIDFVTGGSMGLKRTMIFSWKLWATVELSGIDLGISNRKVKPLQSKKERKGVDRHERVWKQCRRMTLLWITRKRLFRWKCRFRLTVLYPPPTHQHSRLNSFRQDIQSLCSIDTNLPFD